MSDQLTVRLPPELARALRAASRRTRRKSSEIVRMALRVFLETPRSRRGRASDSVRGLLGSLESGIPDLAERHRDFVLDSLRNGE